MIAARLDERQGRHANARLATLRASGPKNRMDSEKPTVMGAHPTRAGVTRWIIWGLLLTGLNGCYAWTMHMEDAHRRGTQCVFGPPAPPLLPEWAFYIVDGLLALQLVVSAIAVWRIGSGRWWLAAILVLLWLLAVFFAEIRFG